MCFIVSPSFCCRSGSTVVVNLANFDSRSSQSVVLSTVLFEFKCIHKNNTRWCRWLADLSSAGRKWHIPSLLPGFHNTNWTQSSFLPFFSHPPIQKCHRPAPRPRDFEFMIYLWHPCRQQSISDYPTDARPEKLYHCRNFKLLSVNARTVVSAIFERTFV